MPGFDNTRFLSCSLVGNDRAQAGIVESYIISGFVLSPSVNCSVHDEEIFRTAVL